MITTDEEKYSLYEKRYIRKYAIVPIEVNVLFTEEQWFHFYELILSIYPSDFSIIKVIHLSPLGEHYQRSGQTFYHFRPSGEGYFENFMHIGRREYKFVSQFLRTYFQSSLDLQYLKYILSVFSNSFSQRNAIYQYLSLIICLEVTVEGNEQLTYKLKRNIALLCGDSVETCKLIFNNVNQLYKLRSAIVHGNIKPSYKHFREYHDYLKTLVARLIRELIVHNIPTIEGLNEKLTSLGYGQNKLISKNYTKYKYPIIGNVTLSFKSIQKY